MPELPEVETVRRGLEPRMVGRRLVHVDQRRPDLRMPFPERFVERLQGRLVTRIERRAKYMLWHLDGPDVLIVHLGMSGRIRFAGHNLGPLGTHDHVVLATDDGTHMIYEDHRRFGLMTMADAGAVDAHPLLASLGPEPLGDDFTAAVLDQRLAGKITPIKAALLDQRIVAGLGNIYVCEALHRAGISPKRTAATVPGTRSARLVPAIKQVLEEAIAAGGSTLRDYVQTSGELGYFQKQFAVYDREDEPCAKPGCRGVVRRLVQSGRSTFHCSACQK
ncbi:bifunctional DNA-formamidopyrimidine glycosylase/DNA-(apurinic or apyrimidinic site) lyase [Zavarzinia sp. CC-PAN008]|uniref:bifunctional DNA-formamidopyrimidine glycosylase/DNA-(apurinic or apyrimidinic site) lyase n=1 Tax=Zavarzinia sp. CC-PAN008 TaxID=3243332 RepID=UPI003F749B8E